MGRMIAVGEYAAGETIPMESDLEERFAVSRTVVREAIKVLSGKGMVRTARRYGTSVRPFEDWHLLDPDVILWHAPTSPMAARIYSEATELRCMVEPRAAALAAARATGDQKKTLLTAAAAVCPDPYGIEAMMAADYAFHATILEASGNIMLVQLQGLILTLIKFAYPSGAAAAPEMEISRESHMAVATAIDSGHPGKARKLMTDMLASNRLIAERLARSVDG